MKTIQLENKGSLITIAGTNQCLGYLMNFQGHGVFDANHGMVDVTPKDAKTHNDLLSAAEIEGLDKNCQLGQRGTLFFNAKTREVHTWVGTIVSTLVRLSGKRITFFRDGKEFRGILHKEADCFNFKRVA